MLRRVAKWLLPGLAFALALMGPIERVQGHGSGAPPADFGARSLIVRAPATPSFMNFETAHVHPLDINPSGTKLAVVNTADAHVEIFDIDGGDGTLTHAASIPVGYDPVTARWRTDTELWVVNQVSDSISIVDTTINNVVDTIVTYRLFDSDSDGDLDASPNGDEPADVVFGTRDTTPVAVVSCSRTDVLQVYEIAGLTLTDEIAVDGEDPRALAINTAGIDRVYAAIFESGNSSTLISGAGASATAFPPSTAALNLNGHTDHPYYWNGLTEGGGCCDGTFVVNPPPNDGSVPPYVGLALGSYEAGGKTISVLEAFTDPPFSGGRTPPSVAIIVKKDFSDSDKWKDDVGSDWTRYITGDRAAESGRLLGWDLLDNDIAIQLLDTGLTAPTYATRQMNICMAIGINPMGANAGRVYMVGTDATNEVRFEPNITGTFVRVMLSITNADGTPVALVDLNETHLDAAQSGGGTAYQDGSVVQLERDKSIGDPRGVTFDPTGARVYISGMGSNNVLVVDSTTGARLGGVGHTIEVGFGPTGLAHHSSHNVLYVVNKFDASVSVVDTSTVGSESIIETLEFYDPTPAFINTGRVHFYGTHETSGLGQLACASCHVDGHMDRLAWDLGNPAALLDEFDAPTAANITPIRGLGDGLVLGSSGTNPPGRHNTMVIPTIPETDFDDFHPMKGPMTTQTFQDIIGKEPHHWRGDRDGIEEFSGAFEGLQGRDFPLNGSDMLEFEDFVSTIHFPPNPFRLLDNTLPGGPNATDTGTNKKLDMKGFFSAPAPLTPKSFSATGTPMETTITNGSADAWLGFNDYVDGTFDSPFRCVDCHTLPIGAGPTHSTPTGLPPFLSGFTEIPLSTLGNAHIMMVSVDGTGQKNIKVPQLRNQFDKEGYFLNQGLVSRAGFGLVHDGAVDGLARFLSEPAFQLNTDQKLADMIAFALAIGGADFDLLSTLSGAPTSVMPPAAEDKSAHSGVGQQRTIDTPTPSPGDQAFIDDLIVMADAGQIDLIARTVEAGVPRGWYRLDNLGGRATNTFQSDENGQTNTLAEILTLAGAGTEITFMAVPEGSGERMGVDRDEDGAFSFSEILDGTDPADPASGGAPMPLAPASNYSLILLLAAAALLGLGAFASVRIRRET